jgi:hypothetical protein
MVSIVGFSFLGGCLCYKIGVEAGKEGQDHDGEGCECSEGKATAKGGTATAEREAVAGRHCSGTTAIVRRRSWKEYSMVRKQEVKRCRSVDSQAKGAQRPPTGQHARYRPTMTGGSPPPAVRQDRRAVCVFSLVPFLCVVENRTPGVIARRLAAFETSIRLLDQTQRHPRFLSPQRNE